MTGVQTCALPIFSLGSVRAEGRDAPDPTPTPDGGGQNRAQGGDEGDGGTSLLPLWILLGALAVVAVTATVVVFAMNSSKRKQLAAQGAYPGAPQYEQYPAQPDYPVQQYPQVQQYPRAQQQYPAQPDYPAQQQYPAQPDRPAQSGYASGAGYAQTEQVPLSQADGYDSQRYAAPTRQYPGRGGYDPPEQSPGYGRPGQQPYSPRERPGYDPQQPYDPNGRY